MVSDDGDGCDPKLSLFDTTEEARKVAIKSRAVVAYGGEIFKLGTGEPLW